MKAEQAITEKDLIGFENLLAAVNIDSIDFITPYPKRYLQHILAHKKYYCRIYAHVLNLALQHSAKSKGDICLVDYGAGNGVLGLLAKYCGFGKVFINEVNTVFLLAAKKLSQATGVITDGFIEGDIEQVKSNFKDSLLDVVVSTDVIEHIYDLEHFFRIVKEINPGMVTVMSTACNPANYFKVKEFKKLQIKDELYGGSPDDNVLFGNTAIRPFIEIRKKAIISFSDNKLTAEDIDKLATLTRGLQIDGIKKAVDQYISTKTLPVLLSHPTNTCDPVTGSWSERLMSFDEYKTIYSNAGFELKFYDGFYNEYESNLKSRLLYLANKLVPFVKHKLSPFITLVGKA